MEELFESACWVGFAVCVGWWVVGGGVMLCWVNWVRWVGE